MIIVVLITALAAFLAYKSYTPGVGFDLGKGIAALVATAAAAWAYIADISSHIIG